MIYRLAPEWGCWPLWEVETGDNVDPATLGLPPDLLERLMVWDNAFQNIFNSDDPLASAFPNQQAEKAYAEAGEKLAQELTASGINLQAR